MPTNNNDDELVKKHSDYFVREITIKDDVTIERLLKILRQLKTTGDLRVRLNQGGVQVIQLHECRPTSDEESDQIREILGIEEKSG